MKDISLKEELKSMYNAVNENNDVAYITIVTKSMGPIKCSNLNFLKLILLEQIENEVKELAYDYRLTNKTLEDVRSIFQQAKIVNSEKLVKLYTLFSHKFYNGEVVVSRPKTEIIFEDTYFIAKNVECMDERFKHVIIRYDDFEYIFTQ